MTDAQQHLLLVDDELAFRQVIAERLGDIGYRVEQAGTGEEALERLNEFAFDVLITDLRLPGVDGRRVLDEAFARYPEIIAIVITGFGGVREAVDVTRLGAEGFITKPFQFEELLHELSTAFEKRRLKSENAYLRAQLQDRFKLDSIVGRTPVMMRLFELIHTVSATASTVLITGETGTGKELVARALHALAAGPQARLVTVNCSAVVESLFESELFGHQRGAFTGATDTRSGLFERADGGTLFLDEIGELPLALQSKLLRAVEYGEVQRVGSVEDRKVEVRIIAATNRDLRTEVVAGRFRSDLFYRLAIIEIRTIPLRERREDIAYLTASFLSASAQRLRKTISGLTPGAERLLQNAAWPGNIRELSNVIERACILSDGRILGERDIAAAMSPAPVTGHADDDPNLMANAQRGHVERVLSQVGGNKTAAARLLGISRRSIYRRLDRRSPAV